MAKDLPKLNLAKNEIAMHKVYDWLVFSPFNRCDSNTLFYEEGQLITLPDDTKVKLVCLSRYSNCFQRNRDGNVVNGWPNIKLICNYAFELYSLRYSLASKISQMTGYDTIITSYPISPKTENESCYKNTESVTFGPGEYSTGIYWNLTTHYDKWSFDMEIRLLLSFNSFDERLKLG